MGIIQTRLSVVIPTLDEEQTIGACLERLALLGADGVEMIVSDGGSSDSTVQCAVERGATVVTSGRGRARQMNAGSAAASGALLAFLHADTRLSPRVWDVLLSLAHVERPVWGRFDVRLSGSGVAFRVIETLMNLRSRLTGIATGDQLIFVSTDLFREVGGFPDIALMEDVALSAVLRRRCRPMCRKERVETSSRKWRQEGIVSTVLLMWRLRLAYALGADPSELARRYYRERRPRSKA